MSVIVQKYYNMFAGVNGAGKTTLYKTYSFASLGVRINIDEILVKSNGDWTKQEDQAKALMVAMRLLNKCIENNQNINHETLLTGDVCSFINNIKNKGYVIRLYYVGVDTVEIAIKRVEERVKKGGHGILREDIIRRYNESMDNLINVIKICDEIIIFDNTNELKKIASIVDGKLVIVDKYCKWFNDLNLWDKS